MRTLETSVIRTVATGVPGLDAVLGGGLCEYSLNLVAGPPGAGKTTLVQQILFANATPERPALCFTVLGEPTVKMMRYQQAFSFFDAAKVPSTIRFVNLSEEAVTGDLDAVLARIASEVNDLEPAFVAIDSFRTIGPHLRLASDDGVAALGDFVQRLAQYLASWETTSFVVADYSPEEQRHPAFVVADSILSLSEIVDRSLALRMLRVAKIRGRSPVSGLHAFRITGRGVEVFPRIPVEPRDRVTNTDTRLHTGVPGLDEMMGGGIPEGDVMILTGPAGSGKTTFAAQFAAQGLSEGQNCVIAVFEEYPTYYLSHVRSALIDFDRMIADKRLAVIYLRPMTLSVDEILVDFLQAVQQIGAKRVVIDSLSGFEIALAPSFRVDFAESLYRFLGALTATGVTVLMTSEISDGFPSMRFTNGHVSFVTDDIVVQRYVEIDGCLEKVVAVVKMRSSAHSAEFRVYSLTPSGAVIGEPLTGYHGITRGVPTRDDHCVGSGADVDGDR